RLGRQPVRAKSHRPPLVSITSDATAFNPALYRKRSGPSGFMVGQSGFGKPVQLSGAGVCLDLPVPFVCVIFSEPVAKRKELRAIELLDFAVQFLDLRHAFRASYSQCSGHVTGKG